jgi:hypothetical protein
MEFEISETEETNDYDFDIVELDVDNSSDDECE